MTFEILTPTDATLTSVTPRTEKHGEDDVFAISLGLTITGPNTMLDGLAPGLRDALYKPVEGQEQLPGVEPATPVLRAKVIDSVALDRSFEGWTIHIDHGINEADPIALGGARVDKFKVVPHEGGSVDLSFRIGSSDIDAEEAGALCTKLRQTISFTLTAPAIKKGETIDGSTAAFERDHPGATQGSLLDGEALTPEQALAASAGEPQGQEVDPDDEVESEGGQPDADADAEREQAELEAGMRESLDKAGVAPKGRGRRAAARVE